MNREERRERALKVLNHERCKHGMIFEYCAMCQEVKVPREYKFPIEIHDDETGETKEIWLGGITEDVFYHTYRQRKGFKQSRKGMNRCKAKSANYVLKSGNPRL